MGEEISYCSSCKASILEKEFENGDAVALLGRRYCARCKPSALKSISLEEVLAEPPAGERPSRTPPPSPPKKAVGAPRPPQPAPFPFPLRLLLPAAAAAILLTLLIALFPRGKPVPRGDEEPPSSPDPREEAAERAWAAAERAASGPDTAAARKAIEAARPACRGTPWETRLRDLETRILRREEDAAAGRELARLTAEIKDAVAGDPGFTRYASVMEKVQQACRLAARTAPEAIPEIQKLVSEYADAYEKQAEPVSAEITETANGLAQERRYEDALKVIDSFPRHLRHSRAWTSLEGLRRRIENLKKEDAGLR